MPSDLRARVDAVPYWYHRIELPDGIVTPGWAPLHAPAYRIPDDLTGKRVLDVGAWDGFWTFEALKRGAREVVAIDDFSDYLGSLDQSDRKAWETFDLCREALGYDETVCQRREFSIYEVSEEDLGQFDVVLFFGALYHLRYPLLGLDRLASVCNGLICIETAILDDYSPYNGGLGKGYPGHQVLMEFYPGNQYGNNESNWWVPTLQCVAGMLEAAGFENVRGWKLTREPPAKVAQCRASPRAQSAPWIGRVGEYEQGSSIAEVKIVHCRPTPAQRRWSGAMPGSATLLRTIRHGKARVGAGQKLGLPRRKASFPISHLGNRGSNIFAD